MPPGSLVHRYVWCGTQTCRRRKEEGPGHGLYGVLALDVGGKPTARSLPATAAEYPQSQIA